MKIFYLSFIVLIVLSCSQNRRKTVLIQPYGDINQEFIIAAKSSIEENYNFKVHIANPMELPQSAFVNIKSPRYRADSILIIQKNNKPDSIDFIIGLTNKDISTTKRDKNGETLTPREKYEDWGIFGLGFRPGCSALVSTYRLRSTNKKLLLERLKKVCNHELGHNLGLPHCTDNESCVLRDAAETIKTIDTVSDSLCIECKLKV